MSVSTDTLLAALSAELGAGIRPATTEDAVMGVQPRVVVEPADEEQVAAALAYADRAGLKTLVRGGGTQLAMGNPPAGGDILLSTARLNALVEHAPHDQTVTVQAGMRLSDLQQALGRASQWLALDPLLPPDATIGGIIATNATGARRLRYGGVRDAIIGIRVALADGTLASGGGKVVKNVAGYDLPKLYTGSLGTLGVIVSANFRLYPLLPFSGTATFTSPMLAPLCALVLRLLRSTLVPTIIDLLPTAANAPGERLAVRIESGVAEAVSDQLAALAVLGGELGLRTEILADDAEAQHWRAADGATAPPPGTSASLLLKASLLPTALEPWLTALVAEERAGKVRAGWRAHAGHGIVFARLVGTADALSAAVERLRHAALAERGSLVVLETPEALAGRLDPWGPVPALGVMGRIKQRFDPNGTLNPGRYVGGL